MDIKTYSQMMQLSTFDERFDYLKLNGKVCGETFGFDRYLNQQFYKSPEWKKIREQVIIRDNGCDLGIPGMEIGGNIYVHHMNPLSAEMLDDTELLLNPEYLICVSMTTHNAIHYGDKALAHKNDIVDRKANDTCPWRK